MDENEEESPFSSDSLSDSLLSQDSLDALIAAANVSGNEPADDWSSGFGEDKPGASVGAVDLPSFGGTTPARDDGNGPMSRIKDIPLDVTVELGRTRLLIRDILDLNAGSIVELEKIAGEPVDLLANGLLVARGEVIVIDDNFGVRLTEIITAGDRQQIKENDSVVV